MLHSRRRFAGQHADRSLRLEPLEKRHLLSASPAMVGDVNQTPVANTPAIFSSIAFAGKHYFVAETKFGVELWSSDGTTAGTTLVKDIHPGSAGMTVLNLVAGEELLYFFANDGAHGAELWRTDGTEAGTLLVKDIAPGALSGAQFSPRGAFVNDDFFFTANDGVNGPALWKSDGTVGGTTLVKDIRVGLANSEISYLVNVNGVLYFGANDGVHGKELWRSDGTLDGTFMVADVAPGAVSSDPRELINLNGTLLFSAADGVAGAELWRSAGTAATTSLVEDLIPGPSTANPSTFRVAGDISYFITTESNSETRLWRTDGTAEGTWQITKKQLRTTHYTPAEMELVDGTLYFPEYVSSTLFHLWKYEPTAAAPELVYSYFSNGSGSVNPKNVNGVLYFTASAGAGGSELWRSDGTQAGTTLAGDLWVGSGSSNPDNLTNVNGTLFLFANDGTSTNSLWKVESSGAPERVATLPAKTIGSSPSQSIDVDGILYFVANDGLHGQEIWKVAGTGEAPVLVADIAPGVASGVKGYSNINLEFTNVGGVLYFVADDGVHGDELWKIEPGGLPTMVKDIALGLTAGVVNTGAINPQLTNVGGVLYFVAWSSSAGRELWRSDGTADGTFMVKDVNPQLAFPSSSPAHSNIEQAINVNGVLYFVATDGQNGLEIWRSDGTAAGTVMATNFFGNNQKPTQLTNVSGNVYFTMTGSFSDNSIWKTNGTAAGTVRVKSISSTSFIYPEGLTSVGGLLYFVADDGYNGRTVWRSDGTAAGTFAILNSNPQFRGNEVGSGASARITDVNGVAYFVAYGSANQSSALWISNGSIAGTINVTASEVAAYPARLTNIDGTLYFTSSMASVDEIWSTNGSPGEMTLHGQVYRTSNAMGELTRSGEALYFAFDDGSHGAELWRLAVPPRPAGDFNGDRTVDGADFLSWQRNFGSVTTPAGRGADGDGDGTVGAGDLDVWRENFGAGAAEELAEVQASAVAAAVAALGAEEAVGSEERVAAARVASEIPLLAPPFKRGEFKSRRETARDALFSAGDFSRLFGFGGDGESGGSAWRRGCGVGIRR
jgi:ELWxxDGT repeat protein